jgi:hypothetical protein
MRLVQNAANAGSWKTLNPDFAASVIRRLSAVIGEDWFEPSQR